MDKVHPLSNELQFAAPNCFIFLYVLCSWYYEFSENILFSFQIITKIAGLLPFEINNNQGCLLISVKNLMLNCQGHRFRADSDFVCFGLFLSFFL